MSRPLWTPEELTQALGAPTAALDRPATGVSIDTRTLKPGDLFVAIKGDSHDGHDHVARAFEAGAVAALVARDVAPGRPQFVVDDALRGMERLGAARAGALAGAPARDHRLRRQDQRQGDGARGALGARADARLGRLVQQPLGRAADPGAAAGRRGLRRVRDRHEPRRRDHAAGRPGAPACRARHHHRAGPHRAFRLARGDRRRQGGDLLRRRAGRRRRAQPRRAAVRAAGARGPHARSQGRELRREPWRRRAADRLRAGRRGFAGRGRGRRRARRLLAWARPAVTWPRTRSACCWRSARSARRSPPAPPRWRTSRRPRGAASGSRCRRRAARSR